MKLQSIARGARGFTLIEMMIATSVSGVLASVAYPSFTGCLHKVHRTEALVALMQVQHAEERWRSNSVAYGTLAQVGVSATAPGGRYALSVSAPSASGYEAVAVATGSQAGDRPCRYMSVRVDGGNATYLSGETAALGNVTQVNRQCWNQ